MHMPLMVELKSVVVFGGERGEGLQKTQKLALFADELLVVPEARGQSLTIDLPAGAQSELKEKLLLKEPRSVPVYPKAADQLGPFELGRLLKGRSYVVSDVVDRKFNERLKSACDRRHILCTVVDTKDLCSAWFMGLIQTEHLTVAISSGGTISFFVPRLREYLTPLIEAKETEASVLSAYRGTVPKADREEALAALFADPEFRRQVEAGTSYDALLNYAMTKREHA